MPARFAGAGLVYSVWGFEEKNHRYAVQIRIVNVGGLWEQVFFAVKLMQ